MLSAEYIENINVDEVYDINQVPPLVFLLEILLFN